MLTTHYAIKVLGPVVYVNAAHIEEIETIEKVFQIAIDLHQAVIVVDKISDAADRPAIESAFIQELIKHSRALLSVIITNQDPNKEEHYLNLAVKSKVHRTDATRLISHGAQVGESTIATATSDGEGSAYGPDAAPQGRRRSEGDAGLERYRQQALARIGQHV